MSDATPFYVCKNIYRQLFTVDVLSLLWDGRWESNAFLTLEAWYPSCFVVLKRMQISQGRYPKVWNVSLCVLTHMACVLTFDFFTGRRPRRNHLQYKCIKRSWPICFVPVKIVWKQFIAPLLRNCFWLLSLLFSYYGHEILKRHCVTWLRNQCGMVI